jgi:hypothetical protein
LRAVVCAVEVDDVRPKPSCDQRMAVGPVRVEIVGGKSGSRCRARGDDAGLVRAVEGVRTRAGECGRCRFGRVEGESARDTRRQPGPLQLRPRPTPRAWKPPALSTRARPDADGCCLPPSARGPGRNPSASLSLPPGPLALSSRHHRRPAYPTLAGDCACASSSRQVSVPKLSQPANGASSSRDGATPAQR